MTGINEYKKYFSEIDEWLGIPDNEFVNMAPSDVKLMLNTMAIYIQLNGHNEFIFSKIHLYMHKYIWNQSYNHYIITGQEGKDLYQECLIAMHQKVIPKFNPGKNMSFFNFAKMCMNRHLITLLNASKKRKKDQALNTAIPLDQAFSSNEDEDGGGGTLMNVIAEDKDFLTDLCAEEDKEKTAEELRKKLSRFENSVLTQYLENKSYKEIARLVSFEHQKRYKEKSIDNALLRIRNKAVALFEDSSSLPLFIGEIRCKGKSDKNESYNTDRKSKGRP